MNIKTNLLLAAIILGGFFVAQELRATEKKPAYSKAECEVWNREKSFAASVENHDAKAFAAHLDAKAIFVNGDGSFSRGRDGVTKDWAGIIEGKSIIVRTMDEISSLCGTAKPIGLSVTFGSIVKVVVLFPRGIKIVTWWPRRARRFASSIVIRVPPRLSSPMVGITIRRLI